MAVYEINGSRYELPDDLQGDQLTETLMHLSQRQGPEVSNATTEGRGPQPGEASDVPTLPDQWVEGSDVPPVPEGLTPAEPEDDGYIPYGTVVDRIPQKDLYTNEDWIAASREIYRMNEGVGWSGSDEELAKYGISYMGWVNYNLANLGMKAGAVSRASQEQKEAFLHLMDQYDAADMNNLGELGRFAKGVATDPFTYLGLKTLGLGLVGRKTAQTTTKEGLRHLLRQSVRTGTIAGIEGAIYTGAEDHMRQTIELQAGRREERDYGQTGRSAAIGAGAGFVLGSGLDIVADKIASRHANRLTPEGAARVDEAPPQRAANDAPAEGPLDTPNAGARSADEEALAGELIPSTRTERAVDGVPADGRPVEGDVVFAKSMDELRLPNKPNDLPFVSRNMEKTYKFARALADDLKALDLNQAQDIAEQFRTLKMTQNEYLDFSASTKSAVDDLRVELKEVLKRQRDSSGEQFNELLQKQYELEGLLGRVALMDEALSSSFGSGLKQQQEGLQGLRGVTLENIRRENPDMSEAEVMEEYISLIERAERGMEAKTVRDEFDRLIEAALREGDTNEAIRQAFRKSVVMDDFAEEVGGPVPGPLRKAINKILRLGLAEGEAGWTRKWVELSIANVFSTTTLMVNVVPSFAKMLYRPTLKAIQNNPAEAATRRELVATYSAMWNSMRGALSAANAAFRYEQSILTHEAMKMMDGELAIKGVKGGLLRFIPRLMNHSDEFMGRMAYEGYIGGRAAAEAYEEAVKRGLKGSDMDDFIKNASRKAIEDAYITDADSQIAVVARKARNLGYKGRKLEDYVVREVQRSGEGLSRGTDEEAIQYVREVLYKTAHRKGRKERPDTNNPFLKADAGYQDGLAWMGAHYEEWVNEAPIIRVLGQLFLRTPLRVFEEGMRLTPGVQILSPGYLNDLAGRNGELARVRANGEAMLSFGLTAFILKEYAQGNIMGDGAYAHWKQERSRTDSDLPEPYTIRMADGSTWNYRNFDPIATPFKFIVNGLERWETLEMRKRQGEFIHDKEWNKAWGLITLATSTFAATFRDANLFAGVDGLAQVWEHFDDEDSSGWLRLLGNQLKMTVPNMLHKIARANDPTIDNPANWWQMVESRVLGSIPGYEKDVPKAYDALGNVRKIHNDGYLFNIFSTATEDERRKGRSEVELFVLRELDNLSQQTGLTFAAPTKHRLAGDIDLRTVRTSDGEEWLYDRWQRYYRELNPEERLAVVLDSSLPVGVWGQGASKPRAVMTIIDSLQEAAMAKLLAEETGVTKSFMERTYRNAEIEAGWWDSTR